MKKNPPAARFPTHDNPGKNWHNGGAAEIHLYVRSLQKAAIALLENLERQNPRTDWDACPIVLLYRSALELQLKGWVGEGSGFLKKRTDPLSLSRTHSLRWLAQIVCQIIRKVKWESTFKCESVADLGSFSALVDEVESFDPAARAMHWSRTKGQHAVSQFYGTFDAVPLAKKLDALLDLLEVTADALAAKWDQRAEKLERAKLHAWANIKPSIQ